jgi:hypothetical protein
MSAPKRKRNGPTLPLRVFIADFAVYFLLYARPWKVATATRGITSFNLVRVEKYREVGGHVPIAMRPDDDIRSPRR